MNRWRVLKDSFLKVHQFFPRRNDWIFALAAAMVFLAGCGAPKPVLYPNDHLKRVGEARAQADIQECERLAEAYVQSEAGKDALKNTAAGAAAGLVKGVSDAGKPSPVHRQFVERCLREKGYETLGWQ